MRKLSLLIALTVAFSLSACTTGVSQEEYNKVVSERDSLREELEVSKASPNNVQQQEDIIGDSPALPEESSNENSSAPSMLESVFFSGTGDDILEIGSIKDGYAFYIEGNQAGRHFSVKGYDETGKSTGLYVNTSNEYKGITIDASLTTTTLEISAVDAWTIELRPIADIRTITAGEAVTGNGDEVLRVIDSGSTATITGNTAGRHFAVKSYGKSNNLMVNTSDEYSGNVMLKGEPEILEVTGVGEWSITFN